MKKYAASLVLLLTFVPSFASHIQPGKYSQFRVHHSRVSHKSMAKAAARTHKPIPSPSISPSDLIGATPPLKGAFVTRSRARAAAAATTVNFVTAARTDMGGEDDDNTEPVLGDFNGDGKKDVAKIVNTGCENVISVFLGNGDGTFQTVIQTNTPGNTDDPIIVGDLNGDGKDDIVMVHPGEPATIDVLISNGDGTFATAVNYAVSDISLVGGVLTDIDGDGKLDIMAVDNATPADVIKLLGNGDGTFKTAATLTTLAGATSSVFFADFNGDGKLDMATSDSQVQVYLANSSGFADPVLLVTSDTAYNSCFNTAGDLNGDGMPEIVSVNCDQDTLTVYVNNGDGTFQTGVYYDSNFNQGNLPYEAAIADLNGDGKNDVVVGNVEAGNISVFLGRGDGTLAIQHLSYAIGGFPWTTPLIADFNGDGLMDVVMPDDEFSLMYLQGYGDGSLRASPSYPAPNSFGQETYSFSIATGDFNGDGIADVVIGQEDNAGAPGIVVYLGRGDGTFSPGVNYGDSTSLYHVAVADLNGDGKLDIAATDGVAGTVQIFLGNGDGTFSIGGSYATDTASSPAPLDVVVGDFDHDGKLDLAIANANTNTVGVLIGNGDGTFGNLANYDVTGFNPESLTAADVNGDGYLDLLVPAGTDGPGSLGIFLNAADNSGTFGTVSYLTLSGLPLYAAVGDLDKDGNVDVAVTIGGGMFDGDVEIALGNGDGTFNTPTDYPSSALGSGNISTWPGNIQMVDMDGDGNLDLVYINTDIGSLGVMLGNGDGTINAPLEFSTSTYTWGMALADLNGDGTMDVIAGNDESGGMDVVVNGNGTGAAPNYSLGAMNSSATVTAGTSADYTLLLAGSNGYNGTVSFSCSGLPRGATCTFNPASLLAQGNVALTTVVTIKTTAATAALRAPDRSNRKLQPILFASLNSIGLFGLLLMGGNKRRSRKAAAVVLGLVLVMMLCTLVGCSGSTRPAAPVAATNTPAGSYTVTVVSTGTGTGAPSHNIGLNLVVQ